MKAITRGITLAYSLEFVSNLELALNTSKPRPPALHECRGYVTIKDRLLRAS
jgi:hypothetical protein